VGAVAPAAAVKLHTPLAQEKLMPLDNQLQEAPPAPVTTGLAGLVLPAPPPLVETSAPIELIAPVEDPRIEAIRQHDEIQATLAAAKAEEAAALAAKIASENPHATSVASRNKEIYDEILARRNAPPAVPVHQPVATPMTERTKAEMQVGAQTSLKHAQQRLASFQRTH
jgi:hypothetical protein